MLDIRKCPSCWEIKNVSEFQLVQTNEDFVIHMTPEGPQWSLSSFKELMCKDCVSRILLNEE